MYFMFVDKVIEWLKSYPPKNIPPVYYWSAVIIVAIPGAMALTTFVHYGVIREVRLLLAITCLFYVVFLVIGCTHFKSPR